MGWAIGFDSTWNRDIGYGVPAICDLPKCDALIDRSLGYVCGSDPRGGEYGCGLYFCGEHLAYRKQAPQCDAVRSKRILRGWAMTELAAGSALDRSDWLLLLLDRAALSATGPEELDPVRIQKGMFLLSERGPARGIYDFQAYDWGPFSSAIYSDLASLTRQGYLTEERVPGRTWSTYRVTDRGRERARATAAQVGDASTWWLRQAREFLTTRSFAQLLREIYTLYPDYAVNSRFGG